MNNKKWNKIFGLLLATITLVPVIWTLCYISRFTPVNDVVPCEFIEGIQVCDYKQLMND